VQKRRGQLGVRRDFTRSMISVVSERELIKDAIRGDDSRWPATRAPLNMERERVGLSEAASSVFVKSARDGTYALLIISECKRSCVLIGDDREETRILSETVSRGRLRSAALNWDCLADNVRGNSE